jgi:hypothetical protein
MVGTGGFFSITCYDYMFFFFICIEFAFIFWGFSMISIYCSTLYLISSILFRNYSFIRSSVIYYLFTSITSLTYFLLAIVFVSCMWFILLSMFNTSANNLLYFSSAHAIASLRVSTIWLRISLSMVWLSSYTLKCYNKLTKTVKAWLVMLLIAN